MKLFLSIFSLLIISDFYSQDTIVISKRNRIYCKVESIDKDRVFYRINNDQIRATHIYRVKEIRYRNGLIEDYKNEKKNTRYSFEVYTGAPSRILESETKNNKHLINVSTSGFGPVGAKFSLTPNRKYSYKLDMSYVSAETYYDYLPYGNMDTLYKSAFISVSQMRGTFTFLQNVYTKNRFNVYYSVSAGIILQSYNDSRQKESGTYGLNSFPILPSARIEIGCNYFITKNIYFDLNAGYFGVSILRAGVGYCFH